jgi:hypothetical protein
MRRSNMLCRVIPVFFTSSATSFSVASEGFIVMVKVKLRSSAQHRRVTLGVILCNDSSDQAQRGAGSTAEP